MAKRHQQENKHLITGFFFSEGLLYYRLNVYIRLQLFDNNWSWVK